jgi:Uma2 family endonuclease
MSDEPLKVEEPDLSGTYTARDYLRWQLDELVELIRGKVFKMSPAPTSNHQRIALDLARIFANFFEKKKCEPFVAPFDVYLVRAGQDYRDAESVVEPDVCVICDPEKVKKFGCVGAPDLMVEVLSPSTSNKDRKLKFELYEEFGVREYWIISPEKRDVVLNVLENGRYKTFPPVADGETVTSVIFPDSLTCRLN